MTIYTATAIGLSEGNSGAANRTAYQSFLSGTAADGDVLEIDGMFPYAHGSSATSSPPNFTIRAADPGSTDQGFDIVGTASAPTGTWKTFQTQEGLLMQGLTFTASDAPAVSPTFTNNNPTAGVHFHQGMMFSLGSNTIVEYCSFSGSLEYLLYPRNGTTNFTLRYSMLEGAKYSLHFFQMSNSLIDTCLFRHAQVDNIKNNNNPTQFSNNITLRNSYFLRGRDAFDLAGNWSNFLIEDTIFMDQRTAALDAKTISSTGVGLNQYLTVNRCRFVNCQRAVATDLLNTSGLSIPAYEDMMPKDFTFTDCAFEITSGGSGNSNFLLKGGGRFRYVRPKYYGSVPQGMDVREYININGVSYWPDGWQPVAYDGVGELGIREYDDGDASKEVFAARAAPTMNLEVGPTYFTGAGGSENVAPVLSGIAINPNGGPVGTVLGAVWTLNSDVFPEPTLTFVYKRGTTTIQTGSPNYTAQAADVGEDITLTMTASNMAGSDTDTSAAVAITSASSVPSITGDTLTLLTTAPT